MANLLKKQLIFDEVFQNFLADCHQCKLQLQQTELAFAAPPPQRTQCRYFNLERLVNWASHILESDLSLFSQLLPNLPLYKLSSRLEDKLGWLKTYLEPIKIWKHLLFLTRTLEKQLKFFGLNSGSISSFSERLSHRKIPDFLQPFQQKIFSYLSEQVSQASDFTLLATSDVLESLFGRYKYFSGRCSIKELRCLLLTIPLSTVNFTNDFIREALTTVRCSDLFQWVNNTFGQSMLSKRTILFSN